MSKTRSATVAIVLTAAVILGAVLAVGWNPFPSGDENLGAETAQAPTGEIVRAEEPIVGVRQSDATPNQSEDRGVAGDAAPSSVALHLFGDLDYSSPSYLDAQDRAGIVLGNFQEVQPLRSEILKVNFDAGVAAYQSARSHPGSLNPPLQVSLFEVTCTLSSARVFDTDSSEWRLSSNCDELRSSSIHVTVDPHRQKMFGSVIVNGAMIHVGALTPGYVLVFELAPSDEPLVLD